MRRTPTKVAVVVYALLDEGPRYLLLQTNQRRGCFWQPVTGGVESGETPAEAAVREVEEETGLPVIGEAIRLDHAFQFPIPDNRLHRYPPGSTIITEHGFAVRVPYANPVLDPDEHQDFEWLSFDPAQAQLHWPDNCENLRLAHARLTTGRNRRPR